MTDCIAIKSFDPEDHKIWAITDEKDDQIIGLVFQREQEGLSTLVTVLESTEIMEIDLFKCAEYVIEAKKSAHRTSNIKN